MEYYIESIENYDDSIKAFKCDNYDNYLAGLCTDCGPNNQWCFAIGQKQFDYWNFQNNPNQQYFILMSESKPYLRNLFFPVKQIFFFNFILFLQNDSNC